MAGAPATAETFARAAAAELDQAVPLVRNACKVTLARNLIAATLEELAQLTGSRPWPRSPGSAEDPELALFATREITYRGQLVAAVVADTLENARAAAAALAFSCDQESHDVRLRADHPGLYTPDKVNPGRSKMTKQELGEAIASKQD